VIAENEDVDGQAAGGTLSGVVNVTVRVLDANDQRPVIVVPALNAAANGSDDAAAVAGGLDVCARARAGQRLLHIVASDQDCGPNARLHFTLLDDDDVEHPSSSSSSSYFSVNADDGWIVARQDLSQLSVGRQFVVVVVVTDAGRPPLTANRTLVLTLSEDACSVTAVAPAAGEQVRAGTGRFTPAVISTALVLILVVVLTVVLLALTLGRRRARRLEKRDGCSAAGCVERRWTEADGAEELTAKQRLNGCEKSSSTSCFRHAADGVYDAGVCERACFNVQRQFEVVWQASSPRHPQQVSTFMLPFSAYSAVRRLI